MLSNPRKSAAHIPQVCSISGAIISVVPSSIKHAFKDLENTIKPSNY